jgi:hypothetical protein
MKRIKSRKENVYVEDLALYTMVLSETLVQVLAQKGVITPEEIGKELKRVRSGSKLRILTAA